MPLTFGKAMIGVLNDIDKILGPKGLDLRPTNIAIITYQYPGFHVGEGTPWVVSTVTLPDWLPARHVHQRELASSGGVFEEGDVIIPKVRPAGIDPLTGAQIGFTAAQINPPLKHGGFDVVYRLSSKDSSETGINGDYWLKDFRRDRRWRYTLVLGRKETTPQDPAQ